MHKSTSTEAPTTAINVEEYAAWCRKNHPDAAPIGPIEALTGGQSNITLTYPSVTGNLVLRRPPTGHIMETAHDMAREFQVLRGLQHTSVPTPEPILCVPQVDYNSGLDAPFLVMSKAEGFALTNAKASSGLSWYDRHALSRELTIRLADLHSVDITTEPLSSLGRPEGFRDRQVRRWTKQLNASRSRPVEMTDRLARDLAATRLSSKGASSLVHGDYKFNNTMVTATDDVNPPHITAILDWEMATLGDPLTDIATLAIYWAMPQISEETRRNFETPVDTNNGYPQTEKLFDWYFARLDENGVSVPRQDLNWYLALAAFKISVIVESLYYRYTLGKASSDEAANAGTMTESVAATGLAYLET
ncbi:phosphotransferase family protein [Ancrocorticia sp.]|uniref:phosphotransferase family protein n=1 Tax=Ancrocorticia sp. TaxID=2593684 RepID=UPI003F8FE312